MRFLFRGNESRPGTVYCIAPPMGSLGGAIGAFGGAMPPALAGNA